MAVRDACGVPVGVSTGAWIEPDPERRAALIAGWQEPDCASVNVSEQGFERTVHDTVLEPDGRRTAGNADLVRAARRYLPAT